MCGVCRVWVLFPGSNLGPEAGAYLVHLQGPNQGPLLCSRRLPADGTRDRNTAGLPLQGSCVARGPRRVLKLPAHHLCVCQSPAQQAQGLRENMTRL